MIELDEHLEFITLLRSHRAGLLPGEQRSDALFRRRRWTESAEALRTSGVSDESDDFLEGFHGGEA
jgi:hypothetical protein